MQDGRHLFLLENTVDQLTVNFGDKIAVKIVSTLSGSGGSPMPLYAFNYSMVFN